jgi:hypothetical protein
MKDQKKISSWYDEKNSMQHQGKYILEQAQA